MMNSKQYLLSLCLLLLVSLVLFFIDWKPDWPKTLLEQVWGLGHYGLFMLLAYCAVRMKTKPDYRHFIYILLFGILFGIMIEWLQPWFGRDRSLVDLVLDAVGLLSGLLLAWATLAGRSWQMRGFAIASVLVFLCLLLWPFWCAIQGWQQQKQAFPVLLNAQLQRNPIIRLGGNASYQYKAEGLDIGFATQRYATLEMNDLSPDWSAYRTLNVQLKSHAPFSLTLRLHDRQHEQGEQAFQRDDRFNKTFHLKRGENFLSIHLQDVRQAPATRLMNLQQLKQLVLFAQSLPTTHHIVLKSIYLE